MKEFTTLAVDGIGNLTGEPETMYLVKAAGVWFWNFDPPKSGGCVLPDVLPNGYKVLLNTTSEPYSVKVKYIPEVLEVEKVNEP